MSQQSTLMFSSAPDAPWSRKVADAVVAAWPGEGAPRLADLPDPEELVADRSGAAIARAAASRTIEAADAAVLATFGACESHLNTAVRLADILRQRMIPAVFLFEHPGLAKRRLQGDGITIDAADAPPARVAATLNAQLERQPTIRQLQHDLTVARAVHGGLKGEMDRLHEELHIASSVQRGFIPRELPRHNGVEFGALYRPAGYVSGDIYDIRAADEHRFAFFLADVVGHGVPAALLTLVLSRALQTRERDELGGWRASQPRDVMAKLNAELCEQPEGPHRFATAIYGIIDARTREITLSGAGHPPPLIVPRGHTGRARPVETDGPLLGVFEQATFEQTSFRLADDEALILYTDGLELAFPGEGATGDQLRKPTQNYIDRLASLFDSAETSNIEPDSILRRLGERIDESAGSLFQADDVTAIAIVPRPGVAAMRLAA